MKSGYSFDSALYRSPLNRVTLMFVSIIEIGVDRHIEEPRRLPTISFIVYSTGQLGLLSYEIRTVASTFHYFTGSEIIALHNAAPLSSKVPFYKTEIYGIFD